MEFQMPEVIDIVIGALILIAAIGGLVRGIIKSVSWLPGLVLGFLAVKIFSRTLALIINENSTLSPLWSTYIAVLVLMAGVYLIVRLLFSIFASLLDSAGLGFLDKILGFLFSILLILLVMGFIVDFVDHSEGLRGLRDYFNTSWIIVNIIRPAFAGTVSFVNNGGLPV